MNLGIPFIVAILISTYLGSIAADNISGKAAKTKAEFESNLLISPTNYSIIEIKNTYFKYQKQAKEALDIKDSNYDDNTLKNFQLEFYSTDLLDKQNKKYSPFYKNTLWFYDAQSDTIFINIVAFETDHPEEVTYLLSLPMYVRKEVLIKDKPAALIALYQPQTELQYSKLWAYLYKKASALSQQTNPTANVKDIDIWLAESEKDDIIISGTEKILTVNENNVFSRSIKKLIREQYQKI